ncbi:hypothetical protein HaLaN_17054 [Haematococcus lacustris]|uniref:Uncharacterized protein n=1 Tax=Haematococcus lacustris TaxID=44745 RepID=A0A699ZND8_HAELA|nr:hypothetical protein HaLaN_17054 [Haematococcus lacustris]
MGTLLGRGAYGSVFAGSWWVLHDALLAGGLREWGSSISSTTRAVACCQLPLPRVCGGIELGMVNGKQVAVKIIDQEVKALPACGLSAEAVLARLYEVRAKESNASIITG